MRLGERRATSRRRKPERGAPARQVKGGQPSPLLDPSFPAMVSPIPAGDIAAFAILPSPIREARAFKGSVRDGGRADERERPAAARALTGEGGARAARRLLSLSLPASWARLIDLPPISFVMPPSPSKPPTPKTEPDSTDAESDAEQKWGRGPYALPSALPAARPPSGDASRLADPASTLSEIAAPQSSSRAASTGPSHLLVLLSSFWAQWASAAFLWAPADGEESAGGGGEGGASVA